MKALVYLGPRRMELQDAPEPSPGAGEARVRVSAAAICGSDLHGFREFSPRRIPPLVMGHEVVGVVDAVGGGVASSLEGSRVVAMPVVSCGICARCAEGRPNLCPQRRLMGMDFPGAFADAFTIDARQLLPVPEGLDDEVGSLTEPFANAIHAVDRAVHDGDTVLVIGAGPIGMFAVRAAVAAGARALVVDPVADRLSLARAQGGEPLGAENTAEAVRDATAGEGVDVVIDAAGFPSTWALAVDAVRWGGHIEAIGLGATEGPIRYHPVVAKGVTIVGSYACLAQDFDRALADLASAPEDIAGWITTMRLDEGQAAFEQLVDGAQLTKVVLRP